MLPDISGFELCHIIREEHYFPIIMLTARGEDCDKISGLTMGADDYIVKPFNPLEVVARIKSQLRRYVTYNGNSLFENSVITEYEKNGMCINTQTRKCTLFSEEIALTPIEFDILHCLFEHKGSVVSSEKLFEAVWKEKFLDNNNTVMAHIARLRDKLQENARRPKYIKTV